MKTHFAIVAQPGSGQETLVEVLGRHTGVRMYGELFCRSNYEIQDQLARDGVLIKLGEDPIEFLETRIFSDHDPSIQAIGFVLLYDQARSDSWSKLWSYVRKKLHVVHFKRRNLLDRYLSTKGRPVRICPSELDRIIRLSRDTQRDNDIYFRHTEKFDMFFEALLEVEMEDIEVAVQDLCGFLRLPPGFTDEMLASLPPAPPDQSNQIVNHEELKDYFDGKPEGEFFR